MIKTKQIKAGILGIVFTILGIILDYMPKGVWHLLLLSEADGIASLLLGRNVTPGRPRPGGFKLDWTC